MTQPSRGTATEISALFLNLNLRRNGAQLRHHEDVFEDVLNLEDQYYREGYELGIADGTRTGRIEGRVFGLEKGFDKFMEMGRLSGRAAVWKARLERAPSDSDRSEPPLGPLNGGERSRKHIDRLAALSDPDDLSTDNSEDAVSEVDDRLKDAKAKATLIARIAGETEPAEGRADVPSLDRPARPLKLKRNDGHAAGIATGEMEDFVGLPGARG